MAAKASVRDRPEGDYPSYFAASQDSIMLSAEVNNQMTRRDDDERDEQNNRPHR